VKPRLVVLLLVALLAARGGAKVRVVEVGTAIACTITLGDAVQKVSAVVKDLQGTAVVRG
jgi:hypothetical protein